MNVNFNEKHVYDLARVVDDLDVPVIGFWVKNDFQNELFTKAPNIYCY